MYITRKERDVCLDACDFIAAHSDGADDPAFFEDMKENLMSIFTKAKREHEKQRQRLLVKKYLKEAKKINPL